MIMLIRFSVENYCRLKNSKFFLWRQEKAPDIRLILFR